jgi:hypothetical protein
LLTWVRGLRQATICSHRFGRLRGATIFCQHGFGELEGGHDLLTWVRGLERGHDLFRWAWGIQGEAGFFNMGLGDSRGDAIC